MTNGHLSLAIQLSPKAGDAFDEVFSMNSGDQGRPYTEGVGIRLKRGIEILVVPSRLGHPKTAVTVPVPSGNP